MKFEDLHFLGMCEIATAQQLYLLTATFFIKLLMHEIHVYNAMAILLLSFFKTNDPSHGIHDKQIYLTLTTCRTLLKLFKYIKLTVSDR